MSPYLITCPVPPSHTNMTPLAVSLVEEDCETPTNFLNVIHNLPEEGEKSQFGVCVKGLAAPGDDLSLRMMEWIEVLRALGAEKVFLYNYEVHPNVKKVRIAGGGSL